MGGGGLESCKPRELDFSNHFPIRLSRRPYFKSGENKIMRSKQQKSNKVKKNQSLKLVKGFPTNMTVELHYEDTFRLYTGTTAYATHVFRGNSLYDPDFTGSGHQPRYFDNYSAIYGRYKVLASTMSAEVLNQSSTAGAVLSMIPLTESIPATSLEDMAELPNAKTTRPIPILSRISHRLSTSITTQKVCGLRPGQVNDEDWSAAYNANPTQIWYWTVGAFSMDKSTSVDCIVRVSVKYKAVFYDRKDTPIS